LYSERCVKRTVVGGSAVAEDEEGGGKCHCRKWISAGVALLELLELDCSVLDDAAASGRGSGIIN
jgi:hypothetical protein